MIVWEVVFSGDGEDGSPGQNLETPSQFCLPSETIFLVKGNRVEKCGKRRIELSKDAASGLWMEGMNQRIPEIKATTMVDDRTLCAVGTEKFRILEEAIECTQKIFDDDVGHKFNNKKSTVATSLMSEPKDVKEIASKQQLKHVTSEKQVGYQLWKQRNREVKNQRVAKATVTINRIATIRNIFTFEQREHLVISAGMTQYGVEGGDASKDACASLTSAVTKTLWKDQKRRCK